jgi:hypothetical protein
MATILNRTTTFATNGIVTAAGLHNLIDDTAIYAGLITTQTNLATVGTGDKLLIAQGSGTDTSSPFSTTVLNLFDDALTGGTYTNANIAEQLTYGTATGNRTVSTSATITTGTIPNLTSSTANITLGTIPTLTTGTTTSTAANITNGTVQTLTSSTGTIGTFNSTSGTITNLSTTLAGDFTISQGTGTLGTTGATLGTYGGSTSVPVLAVNAKGQITSTGTAAITSGLTGFRNRIFNGDMRIDQRNAGASQTFTAAAALAYSIDRFYGYCTGANVTGQRLAGTAPNEFFYKFTGAASVTAIGFGTRLEATNTMDLAGSTATLSVQLANSLLTTVTWTAFYATTADDFGTLASPTRTQIATGTFTVTSSLATYSAQISVPSAATTGIEIVFTVGAQTSGTWAIDNVQLEAGSTATEFERRPIGTELMYCQRYFEKGTFHSAGYASAGAGVGGSLYFKSEKRATPTIAYTNTLTSNVGASTTNQTIAKDSVSLYRIASASSPYQYEQTWTAEIEL